MLQKLIEILFTRREMTEIQIKFHSLISEFIFD